MAYCLFPLLNDPRGACHRARSLRRNLAFGRPCEDPDHEAAMRFGGKAPRQRPILLGGMKAMVQRGLSYLGS